MSTATATTFEDSTILVSRIKDPIHDYIPVSPLLKRIIDTPQVQRLRNIKQLGTTSWVWPSGTHTRFEHCLGVAFLARKMVEHLRGSQPELEITNRDVALVEIAGLCHDLGHGPWSHVWDGMFIPEALPGSKWKHEDASEMMLDDLVLENNTPLSKGDVEFIKALIAGEHSRTPHEKAFLFDIVANKRNGLDVDKIDYIHRDSQMIGDPINVSPSRLVNSARVLDNQICYDIKDANHVLKLCQSRFELHKIFYNHKAAKAIEYMIIDGLLAAEPYLKIAERILNPKKFLHLTDAIMLNIQSSEEPELEAARAILDRIPVRDLYKCVDYKAIQWPHREIFKEKITRKKIFEACCAMRTVPNTPSPDEVMSPIGSTLSVEDALQEEDIIVDFSMLHYGMKEKNPLDFVKFYSKLHPNLSQKATPDCYSNLTPQYFAEVLLRVYTKKAEFIGLVQAGYRDILKGMEGELGPTASMTYGAQPNPDEVDLDEGDLGAGIGLGIVDIAGVVRASGAGVGGVCAPGSTVPTPPESEAPTTPKMGGSFSLAGALGGGGSVGGGTGSTAHSRHGSFGSASGSTPFAPNGFMTVSKTFAAPGSPSRKGRGRSGGGGSKSGSLERIPLLTGVSVGGSSGKETSPSGSAKRRREEVPEDGVLEGAPPLRKESPSPSRSLGSKRRRPEEDVVGSGHGLSAHGTPIKDEVSTKRRK